LGVPTLFGDASNSDILQHAALDKARALVITLPDEAASVTVVTTARQVAPNLPIIARAVTEEGVTRLSQLGASDVIHPELEGGLEIVRSTLLRLGLHARDVLRYTDQVRAEHYDVSINTEEERRVLQQIINASENLEIAWMRLVPDSPVAGQTLAEANLRARTGASVVAILRDGHLAPNPKSQTVLTAGDRLGFIGEPEQIAAAETLLGSTPAERAGSLPGAHNHEKGDGQLHEH